MKSQEPQSVTSPKVESADDKPVAIEVSMRVRVEGSKRPLCLDCGHSVMSHGERHGKLFCWSCLSVGQKQCWTKENNGDTGTTRS
jgi:hypothetical protein